MPRRWSLRVRSRVKAPRTWPCTSPVDTLDHPGVVYRGPAHDRRAALADGPDVWEIVARLRELAGAEEDRIAALAAESELHPRQIRTALEFAARHPDDVERRIAANEEAIAAGHEAAQRRRALLQ